MIDQLLAALGELNDPPSARELAEALWLAESLPKDLRVPFSAWQPRRQPAFSAEPPATSPAVRANAPAAEASPLMDSRNSGVRLAVPDEQAQAHIAGVPIRMPAVPALTSAQELTKALSPLRRRYPSRAKSVLDEAATATAIAEFGLWSPQYRPTMDRWLSLTLLVDESVSMAPWRQVVSEFRALLERLGAFRDLRTWRFNSDAGSVSSEMLGGETPGSLHRPRELVDLSGRTLILVVSDCIGAAWNSGRMAAMLEAWCATSPVGILQPMPERMWANCDCHFTPVTFNASKPGLATKEVGARLREAHPRPPERGLAIPVLEMDPRGRWLGWWASLIAGQGRIPGVALFTRTEPAAPPGARPAADEQPTAQERVRHFRAQASPTAYLLAGYLAAAPLSLPVMRLVQTAMLPRSQPAHLAEVLLSDLVVHAADDSGSALAVSYEFRAGVRELLLATLRRSETMRVIDEVSRFAGSRLGSPSGFPAILQARADGPVPASTRFAQVMHGALRAVGGYYAELADKLDSRLEAEAAIAADVGTPITPGEESEEVVEEDMTGPHDPPTTIDRRIGLPAGWETVPLRNPNFIGREELLLDLHNQLASSVTALVPQALHGLGGVGKTQLAIEYAYRFRSEYDLVWWIPAAHHSQITTSFVELAGLMHLPISENHEQTVKTVLTALRQGSVYQRWLLVYDNARSPEGLLPFLPHAAGHILITSLNQEWMEAANTIQVNVFSRKESVELIMKRGRGITKEDADRLADRLGDLPLAVEQAAIWQRQTGMAVAEYLSLLDKEQKRLLTAVRSITHPEPVAEAWGVAFERIATEDPPAAELLQLCAFFGPAPISTQILHAGRHVREAPAQLHAAVNDTIVLHEAIRKIGRYGLAWVEAAEEIRIHRLVQAVLRDRLPEEQQQEYRHLVHLVLASANPGDPDDTANWPMLRSIDNHVTRDTALIDCDDPAVHHVVLDQIRFHYSQGDYDYSRVLAERAIRTWARKLGQDNEATLVASYNLGNALRQLGRYREALTIDRETRDRMMAVMPADHQLVLRITNSYGADLRINGSYDDALQLDQENFGRYTGKFGDDDRNTLRCQNNLAVDVRLKGDFREALRYDDLILKIRTGKFGPGDQDTLFARCMRARDLRGIGDYRAALALHQSVLPAFREVLGEDHLDVLNARLSYAITLYRMGLYAPARSEIEECFVRFDRRFGPEHPGSIMAMTILANPLRLLGHRGQAHEMAAKAHELASKLFGEDHVFTALYATNLAIATRAVLQFDTAVTIDRQAQHRIEQVLGSRHPFMLSSMANLATSLNRCGDADAALPLSRRVHELSVEVRGPNNPLTLMCACNLGLDLKAGGHDDEGTRLTAVAIGEVTELLGADNELVRQLSAGERYEFDVQPPQF